MCLKLKNTFRKIRKNKERNLGLLKDPEDSRDHLLGGESETENVDLTQYTSTVKNQGGAQSCTAHAAILCYEMEHFIKHGEHFWIDGSEQHNYFKSRNYGGLFPNDGGAYLRDACKALVKIGMCPEKLMPYNDSNINAAPGMMTDVMANLWKAKEYIRITSITGMKKALSEKHPVMIGLPIFENWRGLTSDTIPMPEGPSIGGHAFTEIGCTTMIGYDDNRGAFRIQNSWGRAWADKGRAWLPYEYFVHIDWFDAWTIRI